jgi:Zn-dependent protease/CBS domain-containing protein
MFTSRLRLFRLFGVNVYIDASWFLILFLLSWTLAVEFARRIDTSDAIYWMMGLSAALTFFLCIVLHEMGHAVAAQAFGVRTRSITLFLFGGVAELEGEPPSAWSEFVVAIAGPAVSAVLAAGFFLADVAVSGIPGSLPWELVLGYLARINLAVLVFNLVPAFPLDGGRVLRAALWGAIGSLRRATAYAAMAGRGFAYVLIGLGVLLFIRGEIIPGVWLALLGMFLANAARASYENVLIRQALENEPVGRFMQRDVIVVPPWVTLHTFVEDYLYRHHRKLFPVVEEGRLLGVIDMQALGRAPREDWGHVTVGEVMQTDLEGCCITPDTDALEALRRMSQAGTSRLLVTQDGQLAGIITQRDLFRFLELKLELEGAEEERPRPPTSPPVRREEDRLVPPRA